MSNNFAINNAIFVKLIISDMHHPMYKVHVYQFSTKSVYRLVKTLHTNLFAKKS